MAGGRTNDGVVEQRMADSMAVSVSPSTSIASLFLLFESYFFFKPEKDTPMKFVYFMFFKKIS